MTRKASIGVITVALLMSGAMVGVSFGEDTEGIAGPEVLELRYRLVEDEFFALETWAGKQRGQLTFLKRSLRDADGNEVGFQRVECTSIIDPGWICTSVNTLRDGPNTDHGTIVTTGLYNPFDQFHTFAVTGGTGAYENVGGRARQEDNTLTLYLVP